jgi:hypothetical protein
MEKLNAFKNMFIDMIVVSKMNLTEIYQLMKHVCEYELIIILTLIGGGELEM